MRLWIQLHYPISIAARSGLVHRRSIDSSLLLIRRLNVWIQSTVLMNKRYTAKQGQYLVFIFYYTKIHGSAPSEANMQNYFRVSPPSVHQMVLTLEANGFIQRVPGKSRSIRLLIARKDLPDLD